MRKRIWMSITVLLIMGTVVYAQENLGNSWAAFGYQMTLTNIDEGAEWDMGHGLKVLARYSMLSINDNIGFGILFSGRFSFLKETDWISPDTGNVNRITDADYILDFGAMLGASLHGQIIGPLGFGIGAGIALNWVTAKMDTFFTLLYGNVDLDFNVFDLGIGLNAGLKFDISRFVIEVGTDISYSFFKRDSYSYTSEYDWVGTGGIIKADGVSGGASILRVSPYVLFGVKF